VEWPTKFLENENLKFEIHMKEFYVPEINFTWNNNFQFREIKFYFKIEDFRGFDNEQVLKKKCIQAFRVLSHKIG